MLDAWIIDQRNREQERARREEARRLPLYAPEWPEGQHPVPEQDSEKREPERGIVEIDLTI